MNAVSLSESEIEEIVAQIQKAKQRAKEHAAAFDGGSLPVATLHFVGALAVILYRIDKRIGDAVWME